MASVNQTRPHCVNQMGKTHSKPLAARTARHSRGTAWARHAMCESALRLPWCFFLGSFAKFRKATVVFVMSVCLSVRTHGTTRLPLYGFSRNLIFVYFSKLEKIQVSLKLDTPHEDQCTFLITSRSFILRTRSVTDKSCRENRNTFCVQ